LLVRLEFMQILQIAEQVRSAPGVQGIGEVPVADVSIPHDDTAVAAMNPLSSTSAAALARTPAIHPVETVIPASWHNSTVAR
jgi:hypothetical protein